MKYIKSINEHNKLEYCTKCGFLLYPDDGDIECKFCSVLDIIGLTKDTDTDNIYGQLKYHTKFRNGDLYTYVYDLKNEYDLSDEQLENIKKQLNIHE